MNVVLQGKDLEAGRGGGQINNPGVYRSVCLEVSMRTKLCICALQHARLLSDMEGGELSKKVIRKGDGPKNIDHTSEVSLTSFESLVNMVQEIAQICDAREADCKQLRQRWQKSAGLEGRSDLAEEADPEFITAMETAGHPDPSLVAKLEELRVEQDAQTKLLDGLYSWLASPTSLMYDAAVLRKVHQYMDKVLQLFIME